MSNKTEAAIKMSPLDRLVNFVSPERGLARMNAKAQQFAIGEAVRSYDAASFSRLTAGWWAPGTSANKETELALPTLRNRSRELVRNNPYAKRAVQAIATNVVGLGIRPSPYQSVHSNRSLKTVLKKVKEEFGEWADSTDCDFDGKLNFYGLEQLIMHTVSESGECLIRRRLNPNKDFPLQLQVLEPDFIDSNRNSPLPISGTATGEYDVQGIRLNTDGQIVGYWLYYTHPGEGSSMSAVLVPDSEIIHVFKKERPGQMRGTPAGTSSALSLRDFAAYEQAQLIRQKIAACFAIFVTDSNATVIDALGKGKTKGGKGKRIEAVEPGIIEYLEPGKQVTMSNPPGVQNYHEYSTAMLRKIAVGYGVTYEILSGDLSGVNFSSGRMGWIEFHRLVSEWQNLVIVPQFCDKVWGWFNTVAIVMGKSKEGVKARWTPPRREMIDPVKEIKGMSEAVRNGFQTWSETVRQQGFDPEVVLDELIEEQKKFEGSGLVPACNPLFDPTRIAAEGKVASLNQKKEGKTDANSKPTGD